MFDLATFMEKTGVDADSAAFLLRAQQSLPEQALQVLSGLQKSYVDTPPDAIEPYYDAIKQLEPVTGLHEFTLRYLFYAGCAPGLLRRYESAGLPETLFWHTISDVTYKLEECVKVKNIPGIFTGNWFRGFFNLTRFALGRFQFELRPFHADRFQKADFMVSNGDKAINMHIPASGAPFDKAIRLESYRQAYAFFKHEFQGPVIPFVCDSWLLYPMHRQFLPQKSNILSFMDDFSIIDFRFYDSFHDAWRVFYNKADLPPDQLPRDTSLQRAYADWLMAGNRTGSGYGVFFFDGKEIIA